MFQLVELNARTPPPTTLRSVSPDVKEVVTVRSLSGGRLSDTVKEWLSLSGTIELFDLGFEKNPPKFTRAGRDSVKTGGGLY